MDEVISQETLRLAKWSAVLDVVCLGVTWMLGYPPKQMALGLLFGTLFMLLNFQLIGISVKRSLGSSSPEKALETVNNGSAPVVINTQKQPDTDKSQKERGEN